MPQILAAIFGLSLLVTLHEAGHYLFARIFGMRVLRFSIGFGPVLASYRPKNSPTVFQVCAIPFLAYVLVAGTNPAEEPDPNDPDLYANKGLWPRIWMNLGGPLANYLTASVLVFGLAITGIRSEVPRSPMVISNVEAGSPAEKAGLQPGDTVLEANGHPIKNVQELSEITSARAGEPTRYLVERKGERLAPITITPAKRQERGVIGVNAQSDVKYEAQPLWRSAVLAVETPFVLTLANLNGMADLIKRRSTEGVMGPVGMAKLMVKQADEGFYSYVWILVMISVALGYFNLLPLPGLDGGKLIFLAYELVTRKRADERVEAIVHGVGLLVLVGAIALVTLRDVAG
ncbi:MAG TPA: M50 family metallopeptidase [Polyangiales bacterium]|nr:M50 family metallopeptidase [Polyangiales bacterium]